jgi:hypothetical protein
VRSMESVPLSSRASQAEHEDTTRLAPGNLDAYQGGRELVAALLGAQVHLDVRAVGEGKAIDRRLHASFSERGVGFGSAFAVATRYARNHWRTRAPQARHLRQLIGDALADRGARSTA